MFSLRLQGGVPLSEQLETRIAELIISGEMAENEKLPAVREVAKELTINPNTVQKTYRQLEQRGLIYSLPGKGSYVSERKNYASVLLAKAADVITYVEHGVCDMGVVGKDTIMEMNGKFFELVDLGFGKCKFALAGKKGSNFYEGYGVKTIATKYPNVARTFFESKNMDVEIVKIEGSVELAPLLELSNGIVDIVETGTTLKENGLEVIEDIAPISARLIVNMVSMKLRQQEIEDFVAKVQANIE